MDEKIYDVYHQEIELTSEQQACLKYTGDKTLMVKGYAGAGKSLVLMEYARRLLEKYGRSTANSIAFFTFQNTLVSTIREFLKVNEQPEDGIVASTISSYINDVYTTLTNHGMAPKCKFPYDSKQGLEQRLNNVKRALAIHQTKYGKHRFHDIDPEFWKDEFDWMKEMNVWKDDLDYYLTLPRKGRGGKVRMSASDRVTAYRLFICYCDHLEQTGQGDWTDQTLYIIRHPGLIPEDKKFEHILIDEAQDLSLAQMTAIMHLYKKSMIVAMDMNQKIHSRYWTTKLLGIDTTTKKLTKSMRTTKQIEALAESVRSKNDIALSEDDKSLRAIPERSGRKPQIVHLSDQVAERKYVVDLVRAYIKENSQITIGIIAATNKQLKTFSEWLTTDGIPFEQVKKNSTFSMAKPGVKVVTAFGAKGLEFNCVIIPMFAEGYFPYNYQSDDQEDMEEFIIKMRNIVYVSMTRAKNLLTITFWGDGGSRFIADMDPSLYDWVGEPFVPSKKTNFSVRKDVVASTSVRPVIKTESEKNSSDDLAAFLKSKGVEIIDNRGKNGPLWAVGDKSIGTILNGEARSRYGALWTFCERGGFATRHRPAWFTKSKN